MRDRSRSPSGSAPAQRDTNSAYSRRDYGYSSSRGRYGNSRESSYDRRGTSGYSRKHTSSRGGRGDYGSRRGGYGGSAPSRYSSSYSEEYRSKTERNYDNSIFIGNIPFTCTSKDVEAIFKGDFKIVRADIVTNRGQSRGMATVEFSNKDDVREAIDKYDHYEYEGREIFVRQDYPPPNEKKKDYVASSSSSSSSYTPNNSRDRRTTGAPQSGGRERSQQQQQQSIPKPGTEIFVGNLPFSINWQALKDLMRRAGEVVRADVRTDNWGKSRGFGTVVFSTEEAADKAVKEFQGFEIEGRKLDTRPGRTYANAVSNNRDRDHYGGSDSNGSKFSSSRASSKPVSKNTPFTEGVTGDGEISATIFASNLPFVTSVDDLYDLFETIGRVTKAEIQYTPAGKPSGNAVIEFELEELADLAIKNLDNYNYGGRDIKIAYAKKPTTNNEQSNDAEDIEIDGEPSTIQDDSANSKEETEPVDPTPSENIPTDDIPTEDIATEDVAQDVAQDVAEDIAE